MSRVAGHFGEWLQGRIGATGPLALVTVACPALTVEARKLGDGPFDLVQPTRLLDPARAAAFLSGLDLQGGRFTLAADMPPGGGAGVSTAALVALARAAGARERDLASACLAAEGATDPLMLPRPDGVLWASRWAEVLATLPPLPEADVVGGFHGPPVATDPLDRAFPDISDLAAQMAQPLSLAALARIASASAARCTALRGPADDPTPALAEKLGALGHLRAHTGSARGLIFAPGTVPEQAACTLRCAGFSHVVEFRTGGPA